MTEAEQPEDETHSTNIVENDDYAISDYDDTRWIVWTSAHEEQDCIGLIVSQDGTISYTVYPISRDEYFGNLSTFSVDDDRDIDEFLDDRKEHAECIDYTIEGKLCMLRPFHYSLKEDQKPPKLAELLSGILTQIKEEGNTPSQFLNLTLVDSLVGENISSALVDALTHFQVLARTGKLKSPKDIYPSAGDIDKGEGPRLG